MNFKHAAIALTLTLIIAGCFATQYSQQKNFKLNFTEDQFGLIQGLTSPIQTLAISQPALTNSTRSQIYDFVTQNPGVSFRALCSALCLPVGLAEYHLGVLVRSGLVSFVRDGRYKRFFAAKRFSKRATTAICMLRHKTAKKIFEALLCKRQLSHGQLASEVSISSQALSWQMKTIKNTEFVLQVNDGLKPFTK